MEAADSVGSSGRDRLRRPAPRNHPAPHRIGALALADDATYYTVARVGEVPEGQGRVFEVDGLMIAVFLEGGQYYAIDDACPHQGAPLSDGVVFDKSVTCTWHGWRFSLETGRWLDSPRTRVGTYPVRVVDDQIQVAVD
jgi:nitrite reductase (NADH) small subunit/3-phenylpropionate/trans-cinnamate dioxygenase ferredoxin subunit